MLGHLFYNTIVSLLYEIVRHLIQTSSRYAVYVNAWGGGDRMT